MTPHRIVTAAWLFHAASAFAGAAPTAPLSAVSPLADAYDLESAASEALLLAGKPFEAPKDTTPEFFRALPYSGSREIRFNPGKALWAGKNTPFRVQFLHPGAGSPDFGRLFVSEGGDPVAVPYARDLFDFGKLKAPQSAGNPGGYSGFRLHGEINAKGVWDEFASFLVSDYFRGTPSQPGVVAGLVARALAVDTAMSDKAEEFPVFRKFVIERPAKGAVSAIAYALLDGPGVVGAYRFEITPGKALTMKVRARLFFRRKVDRLGIAPFSTMFRYGENSLPRPSDFRPEVHDCDGLLFETEKGVRYWRPLEEDARELRHSVFTVGKPKGFGLRQRDLSFGSYQDLDENYHRKPGVWVTPGADWPEGTLQLIEIPDGGGMWDNVVAYWAPLEIPGPGESLSLDYAVRWAMEPDLGDPSGKVVATRVGGVPGVPDATRYVVDFADTGKNPKEIPTLKSEPVGDAEIVAARLVQNPEVNGWRAIVDIRARRAKIVPVAAAPVVAKAETPATPARGGEGEMMMTDDTMMAADKKPAPGGDKTKPAPVASVKSSKVEPLRPGARVWLERNGRTIGERWDYRAPSVKAE